MACIGCLEKRAKVLKAVGLGRFAPSVPLARPHIAHVAQVNGQAAASEIDATAPIREQFARYLAYSDGATISTITFAAVHLITFAVGQACDERKCAEEQIEAVCESVRRGLLAKYDAESGKRREIVEAKLLY